MNPSLPLSCFAVCWLHDPRTHLPESESGVAMSEALTVREFETYSAWLVVGKKLAERSHGLQFQIGDWLNYGVRKYERGKYNAGLELFPQYERNTLRQFSRVAERIESGNRLPHLGWTHHQLVAPFDSGKQTKLLKQASAEELSVADRVEVCTRVQTLPWKHHQLVLGAAHAGVR